MILSTLALPAVSSNNYLIQTYSMSFDRFDIGSGSFHLSTSPGGLKTNILARDVLEIFDGFLNGIN